MPARTPTIDSMGDASSPRRARKMTAAEERAAWAAHNRADLLENLEMTPAERFAWLERTWAELAALGLLDNAPDHAPARSEVHR